MVVDGSVVGGGPAAGGFAFSADGHGHGEFRNAAIISPNSVLEFAVVGSSGGHTAF